MRLVAQVNTVLRQVNKIGAIVDGEMRPVADMPLPAWVEIVPETPDGPWMMVRYTAAGGECGTDRRAESLAAVFTALRRCLQEAPHVRGLHEES